jgi:hypothetical protein
LAIPRSILALQRFRSEREKPAGPKAEQREPEEYEEVYANDEGEQRASGYGHTIRTLSDNLSSGRFCCKSRLREATKRDSVVLTRIATRSIHDGPSKE